jgi:hypothetical protein
MCVGLYAGLKTETEEAPEPGASTGGQVPSVGRIVHYVSYGTPGGEYPSVDRAAVITETPEHPWYNDGVVGLAVLNPTGAFFNRDVVYDADGAPGTWHWPARV